MCLKVDSYELDLVTPIWHYFSPHTRVDKDHQQHAEFICTWGQNTQETYLEMVTRKRQELLDTDKLIINCIYIAIGLGYLDGQCAYDLVVKPGKMYALISK